MLNGHTTAPRRDATIARFEDAVQWSVAGAYGPSDSSAAALAALKGGGSFLADLPFSEGLDIIAFSGICAVMALAGRATSGLSMTVVLTVKIHDGIVLASDSATSLYDEAGSIINVYNTANKIFNLYKGLPIASTTWGSGSIGHASISTLSKDLRSRFMGDDPDWKIDATSYTMLEVANKAKQFFFDEHVAQTQKPSPFIGYRIAGYSAGTPLPEVYDLSFTAQGCSGPNLLRAQEDVGINWAGQTEGIQRLVLGFSSNTPAALRESGLNAERTPQVIAALRKHNELPLAFPAMPIQDAIALAEFLVEVQVALSRFSVGPPIVGGPIEIAAVTKHEGFKWVRRKHYFSAELNPGERP